MGEADETFKTIYDIVLGAQLTAINTVKVGMTGEETDSLSRDVLAEAGYGDNFGHSLGHGVGLVIHENPRVVPRSTDTLELNTVFTVEPGIYLTGWGGIRIEDIMILRECGAVPPSKASKSDLVRLRVATVSLPLCYKPFVVIVGVTLSNFPHRPS